MRAAGAVLIGLGVLVVFFGLLATGSFAETCEANCTGGYFFTLGFALLGVLIGYGGWRVVRASREDDPDGS